MLITTSCTDKEEIPAPESTPLSIEVSNDKYESRTLVNTTTFTGSAEIGVSLVDESGTTYDGVSFSNLKYTTTGDGYWFTSIVPSLSPTSGKAVAYYPYSETINNLTEIPVTTASQTDYMYSGWYDGLTDNNPTARFQMKHALAAVRIKVKKQSEDNKVLTLGSVSAVSDAFYESGTFDATTGALNSLTGAGAELRSDEMNVNIDTNGTSVDFVVVPGSSTTDITFCASINGTEYIASITLNEPLEQGYIHNYVLMIAGTKMTVATAGVDEWNNNGNTQLGMRTSHVTAVYDVQSTASATQLLGADFDISQVYRMYIDDVETSPVASYTFASTGSHSVKLEMKGTLNNCYKMFWQCVDAISIDVRNLDTSKVTNMRCMFGTSVGIMKLREIQFGSFDTSMATNIGNMFQHCTSLTTLDLSSWDTSNVTNIDYMFNGCTSLTDLNVSGWDTSNVVDMTQTFTNCVKLQTVDVSNWDTGSVQSMKLMFASDISDMALSSLNVSKWNVSEVIDMTGMFQNCTALTTLDVADWDTGKVQSMKYMFAGGDDVDFMRLNSLDVTGWNVSSVIDMTSMFQKCTELTTLNVGSWNTASLMSTNKMFIGCSSLTSFPADNWDTADVIDMGYMFQDCHSLQSVGAKNWDTGKVQSFAYTFSNCHNLETLDVGGWDTSNVRYMQFMFGCGGGYYMKFTTLDVGNWNTGKVEYMAGMFQNCTNLVNLDVSNWNTSNVLTMEKMFLADKPMALTTLDVSKWDVGKVQIMASMFEQCSNLVTLDVSNWNTASVTTMWNMFRDCFSLTTLDVGKWNTGKVKEMHSMFYNCYSLAALDVSGWDTGLVTNMSAMFWCDNDFEMKLTTLDVSEWDTANVTNMSYMLGNCKNLEAFDVSGWDFSKVTTTNAMFYNVLKLTGIEMNSSITALTDCTNMFANINTTGTFKYSSAYDYSKIIAVLPATWTAVEQ